MIDYSDAVLDHYENPRNVGEATGENGVAEVASQECGDRLRLSLRVGPDGTIQEARFRTFGCVAAIAASSLTTVMVRGRAVRDALQITDDQVAAGLGGLPQEKIHCSVLAETAIRAALQDYQRRSGAPATAATEPVPCAGGDSKGKER